MKPKIEVRRFVQRIRLGDLMKLIPDDELVIIFADTEEGAGYRQEEALFDGRALDWWRTAGAGMDAPWLMVTGIQASELEDTVGPVTMITVVEM